MQVPVATSTPTHVLEEVAKRVDAFLRANRNEYTGSRECVYKDVQDVWPVRTIIFIAWQYTHTGELRAYINDSSNSAYSLRGYEAIACLGMGFPTGPCADDNPYACVLTRRRASCLDGGARHVSSVRYTGTGSFSMALCLVETPKERGEQPPSPAPPSAVRAFHVQVAMWAARSKHAQVSSRRCMMRCMSWVCTCQPTTTHHMRRSTRPETKQQAVTTPRRYACASQAGWCPHVHQQRPSQWSPYDGLPVIERRFDTVKCDRRRAL